MKSCTQCRIHEECGFGAEQEEKQPWWCYKRQLRRAGTFEKYTKVYAKTIIGLLPKWMFPARPTGFLMCSQCPDGVLSKSETFEKEYQCNRCGSSYRIKDGLVVYYDSFKHTCMFDCKFYDDACCECMLPWKDYIAPWWCGNRRRGNATVR